MKTDYSDFFTFSDYDSDNPEHLEFAELIESMRVRNRWDELPGVWEGDIPPRDEWDEEICALEQHLLREWGRRYLASDWEEYFYKLPDDAPECLRDFVQSVYDSLGVGRSDWIYDVIYSCFIDGGEAVPDPDPVTRNLISWAFDTWTQSYVDEAIALLCASEVREITLHDILYRAQYGVIEHIFYMVSDFIDEHSPGPLFKF